MDKWSHEKGLNKGLGIGICTTLICSFLTFFGTKAHYAKVCEKSKAEEYNQGHRKGLIEAVNDLSEGSVVIMSKDVLQYGENSMVLEDSTTAKEIVQGLNMIPSPNAYCLSKGLSKTISYFKPVSESYVPRLKMRGLDNMMPKSSIEMGLFGTEHILHP